MRRRLCYRAAVLDLFLSPSPVSFFPSATRTDTLHRPDCPPIIVFHKSPSSHRTHNTIIWYARQWKKSRCELSRYDRTLVRRVLFARHDVASPRVRPIDESNAYPSRPRDGLRFAPAVQRRRDPWRHRVLNPRPHTRAAIRLVFVGSAPRDLVPPVTSPILTLWVCTHWRCLCTDASRLHFTPCEFRLYKR